MVQQRQRRFVGPMEVVKDEELRTFARHAAQRLSQTLEQIAAPLRRQQFS
jgi:hypothetical protein